MIRIAREGFWREHFFSFFGLYPWRCMICSKEIVARQRGRVRRELRAAETEQIPRTSH